MKSGTEQKTDHKTSVMRTRQCFKMKHREVVAVLLLVAFLFSSSGKTRISAFGFGKMASRRGLELRVDF